MGGPISALVNLTLKIAIPLLKMLLAQKQPFGPDHTLTLLIHKILVENQTIFSRVIWTLRSNRRVVIACILSTSRQLAPSG